MNSLKRQHIFDESQQTVIFDESWWVMPIDRHKYYKRISGKGVKCVDFIALDENLGLVMIELKNYHGSTIPIDLDVIFADKVKGTKQLVRVVNKYLGKQVYYKIFFKKLKWWSICPREWQFWYKCQECIANGRLVSLLDVQL